VGVNRHPSAQVASGAGHVSAAVARISALLEPRALLQRLTGARRSFCHDTFLCKKDGTRWFMVTETFEVVYLNIKDFKLFSINDSRLSPHPRQLEGRHSL
jgi:hypothetical protein